MHNSSLPPLNHLRQLTDDTGLLQFATWTVPNPLYGYTLDDNVRALLVVAGYHHAGVHRAAAESLAVRYLSFIQAAQLADGRFHNEMSYTRQWLDDAGSEDSLGRTIWALSVAVVLGPPELAGAAQQLLEPALGHAQALRSPRARAYALLGIAQLVRARHPCGEPEPARALADGLIDELERNSRPDWPWFEAVLTYDNGRLPQALLLAGDVLADRAYCAAGQATLEFLLQHVTERDILMPVGQAGWFPRGKARARYDQQPIDAACVVEACATAEHVLGDPRYRRHTLRAWRWFHGANSEGMPVCVPATGGCHDGLGKNSLNHNQGAESTLAYLQAALAVQHPAWLGVGLDA